MQLFNGAILLSLLCFHLVGQGLLGEFFLKALIPGWKEAQREQGGRLFALELLLGLLFYLILILILKSVGVAWWISCFLPYVLTVQLHWRERFVRTCALPKQLSWMYLAWILVHFFLGLSVFDYFGGTLRTAWTNAYGDLPYHIGMISSFVFGENFPPEQFVFSGEALSYPFFINLWSAVLWFWEPSWYFLSCIFLYQWMILWILLWKFADGDRFPALPWLVLLGGGTFFSLQNNSGAMISQGLGFTTFLSTIWIPQRSSVLGIVVATAALDLFFRWYTDRQQHRNLAVAGLLLGLAPLAHTHICLTVGVFMSLALLFFLFSEKSHIWTRFQQICPFFYFSLCSVYALPFLLQKKGMITITYGHFFSPEALAVNSSLVLFLKNFAVPMILFVFLWGITRRHAIFLPLLFTFLCGWVLRLSFWGWDHIKVFVACYVILLMFWREFRLEAPRITLLSVPFFIFPTLVEIGTLFNKGDSFTIYSQEYFEAAAMIRRQVPRGAVVAGAPDHRSPVLLAGRKMYLGYVGWLWSHGIDYKKREQHMKSFLDLFSCENEPCVSYIYFDREGRKYWSRNMLPSDRVEKVEGDLYKVLQ
ncbi:MAG: hypothetical protein KDD60_02350 [Bdellovibrionales bacterium]|nr:hypothetical protein [Bdellovibrionales bacterium]